VLSSMSESSRSVSAQNKAFVIHCESAEQGEESLCDQ